MRAGAVLAVLACATAALAGDLYSAGHPRILRMNDTPFDAYTKRPNTWIQKRLWRLVVFSPHFDDKLGWYPRGDMYKNLYAVYGDLAQQHPEWILRDARGNQLYIPYACSNGTCPQFAGDVSNPAFRRWWIADAEKDLGKGYNGLFVDDVNMEFRVSDGNGKFVAPINERTGTPMTLADWRRNVADFVGSIRSAFSGIEIIHNSIWFSGPNDDPNIDRQIDAANFQYIEHGVNDSGLTGGTGTFSLHALLRHIDQIHSEGRGVILGGVPGDATGAEYAEAAYFLIANGSDALGSGKLTPENWWPGLNVDLGSPLGGRELENGVYQRMYSFGMALLNPPEARTVTVQLPRGYRRVDGTAVTSVTLGPAQGAVLVRGSKAAVPSPYR